MSDLTFKLVIFLFPLAYSPGPGNMFFAANGARFGFRATLPASSGYHISTWIVTIAIGLGFGWIAVEVPAFLTVIKYAGSAYVLYLAWLLIRAGAIDKNTSPRHANFLDGVLLLLLNPKAYVIMALMFTQFTSPDDDTSLLLVLWISTVFTVNSLIAFSVWSLAGDKLAALFRQEAQAKFLNIFFGVVLAVVAIWMLFSQHV